MSPAKGPRPARGREPCGRPARRPDVHSGAPAPGRPRPDHGAPAPPLPGRWRWPARSGYRPWAAAVVAGPLRGALHSAPMFASNSDFPVSGGAAKRAYVREVFTAIAPTYDRLNRIMSLHLDLRWRRAGVNRL